MNAYAQPWRFAPRIFKHEMNKGERGSDRGHNQSRSNLPTTATHAYFIPSKSTPDQDVPSRSYAPDHISDAHNAKLDSRRGSLS